MSMEAVEQRLQKQIGIQREVEHLENCPVRSHEEFLELYGAGRAQLLSRSDTDIARQLGTPLDVVALLFFTWAGIGVALALTVVAMVYREPLVLLGIPFALLAFVVSPPATVVRHGYALLGAAVVLFVLFCFVYPPVAAMIGAYVVTEVLALAGRRLNHRLFRKAALRSEILFIYLYSRRLITVVLDGAAGPVPEAGTTQA